MPEIADTPGSTANTGALTKPAGRPPAAGSNTRAPSRGFQPMRDLPTFIWMVLIVIAALAHRQLPIPGWLMLHLLFLGAITHAILVWSQYFSYALSRSTQTHGDVRMQNVRLVLANLAAVLVLVGVPTGFWHVTVTGASLLGIAVLWHGYSIYRRMRGALSGQFTRTLRYYVTSAAMLPIGAALGAWVAAGGALSGQLMLSHALINVFGWIGITVAGTLVTLWPTMLRTRADENASRGAARALPLLGVGVVVAALGAALGILPLIALGLIGYAVGLSIIAVSLVRAALRTAPSTFSTLSAGAALLWWIACLIVIIASAITAQVTGGGVEGVQAALRWAAPYLAAGFAAQVLVGALSYLVPVSLGGGPTPVREGTAVFNTFALLRISLANVALFVCAMPVSSWTRVGASALYLIAIAWFIPLFLKALHVQHRAKRLGLALNDPSRRGPIRPEGEVASGRRAGQAVAGLLAVVLVAAVAGAIDPHALRPVSQLGGGSGSVVPDDNAAPVQTVQVTAKDMRFTPSTISVPAGTRLVVELTNTDDTQVHDLVFANGVAGSRLAPGASETIDVGVMTENLGGWCSIAGHRQMGMVLDIVVTGAAGDGLSEPNSSAGGSMGGMHHGSGSGVPGEPSAAELIDFTRQPGDDFAPFDAVLAPLPPADGPTTHRITLPVTEQVTEVAPGVRQRLWTFGGSAPGPVLHGRVGDTFEITLINDGTIGHSIDFHAGALAPDRPMRTIAPGEQLTYTFTATRSGMWMYHCSTMPMTAHIANGMFGAVIIEPNDLPAVDHSYVLIQSELYLGPQEGEVDMDRLATERPDLVTFNGYANGYDYAPLTARVGERVRAWVLDVGPNRASSFHVVGGQFDTVWSEGTYSVNRATDTGAQVLPLLPAQAGFVELVFPEAGNYPFVSHVMIDAERGAHGIFRITK